MDLITTEYSLALQSTGDTYQLQLVPNEIKFELKAYIGRDGTTPTRGDLGLDTTDSPEFADVLITTLPADSWVNNTVKSVLDYITKLRNKVYTIYPQSSLAFSGVIDLTKTDNHYSDYVQTGILDITIAASPIVGGSAEITITANGSAITVTGATLYGDTAIDSTAAKINHLMFTKFEHGIYYAVRQLN